MAGSSSQPRFALYSGSSFPIPKLIPAMILYPSLMTPEIVAGRDEEECIEFLILGHESYPLLAENVNYQLKFSDGLDPRKSYSTAPLFDSPYVINVALIESPEMILGTGLESPDIYARPPKFRGILDKRFKAIFEDDDTGAYSAYSKYYRVRVPNSCLRTAGLYNAFWMFPSDGVCSVFSTSEGVSTACLNAERDGKIIPNEMQDCLVNKVLGEMNGEAIAERGKYCFKVDPALDDINFTQIDPGNPIQSYHPVFFYENKGALNVGHMADLHISARQRMLSKSRARVIEYPAEWDQPPPTPPPSQPPGSTPSTPPPTQPSQPEPPPIFEYYTIVSGDWLSKIAQRYGMTWLELWNYDGGTGLANKHRLRSGDPDLIYPGEVIVVPYTGGPTTTTKPDLIVSPTSLTFTATAGAADPPAQPLQIASSGDVVNWTAASSESWATLDATSGATPATINVAATAAGLTEGTYNCEVTLSAADAANSPQTVAITLVVSAAVPPPAVKAVSPKIGTMVNISSRNVKQILDALGTSGDVDMVLVGGDLIDYIRSFYAQQIDDNIAIRQIWEKVSVADGYEANYADFVDHIAFVSLVVHFYQTYRKPVFVVTGNHDCYHMPYGIAPRAQFLGGDIKRANEGIAADHNLLIYEAILIFGDSYKRIVNTSIFEKEMLKWFYAVYTPFSDFAVDMPNQVLIGLAWGDDEDSIMNLFGYKDYDQGWLGHLPRADDVVKTEQLQLVQDSCYGKMVLLMSHFTFVSYLENVPMINLDEDGREIEGEIEFDQILFEHYGKYDMGTFELNRKQLYKDIIGGGKLQCTIGGHSHRHGAYEVTRVETNTLNTRYLDFGPTPTPPWPLIMVSDSGGNLPRFNRQGEFGGWGSHRPSGSIIAFSPIGDVADIETVPVGPSPRFVVALDYYDVIAEQDVIDTFESDEFAIDDENLGRAPYQFRLLMNADMCALFDIDPEILIYCYAADGSWKRVHLNFIAGIERWVIADPMERQMFFLYFANQDERANFMSIKFWPKSPLVSHYSFEERWNFEFQIVPEKIPDVPVPIVGPLFGYTLKKYHLKRDKEYAEEPDFDWRNKYYDEHPDTGAAP